MITEFCENGTVKQLLESEAKIDVTLQYELLRQSARGIHHLHSEGFVLRDVAGF